MEGHSSMCTVSWIRTREGYQLLCNRDERHTRRPAQAPTVREDQGVQFIAPIDGDEGGSWIGVNQFGLTLCLLNRYDPQLVPADREGRTLHGSKGGYHHRPSGSPGISQPT